MSAVGATAACAETEAGRGLRTREAAGPAAAGTAPPRIPDVRAAHGGPVPPPPVGGVPAAAPPAVLLRAPGAGSRARSRKAGEPLEAAGSPALFPLATGVPGTPA
ncbi:hypothetical protein RND61_01075 [Streptomyces sp. TRM76323]|uniref:Uncharacterized protein n=1 Tax=Streptomyces tamarix TaxID=3078565 RepID=A0ABU3QD34_9ACTN|nr:hypothetical protein [Streptomyces tamarix]MDT9680686.1 hypothetical protein [Streptomyces tamarix]